MNQPVLQARWPQLLIALATLLPCSLQAANGYFPHGWGPRSAGLAGAGVALAEDAMNMATNPAALAGRPQHEFQLALSVIRGMPSHTVGDFAPPTQPLPAGAFPLLPGYYEADPDVPADLFFIPQGAVAYRLNEQWAAGLAVFANGGLNATFSDFANPLCPPGTVGTGTYCGGRAASNLGQLFVAPSLAVQVNDRLRLGGSLILALQYVELEGFSAFAAQSSNPSRMGDLGHDYALGVGAKFGVQWAAHPDLDVGLTVQTRIRTERLDKYAGLLPDRGRLDIPPYVTGGLAWRPAAGWTVAADVQHIAYAQVRAMRNRNDAPGQLGDRDGPGFGWRDATIYKLGVIHEVSPTWQWRAGYSNNRQPLNDDQLFLNIVAGSVLQDHYSAGLSYRSESGAYWDAALTYAPKRTLSGVNATFPQQSLDIELGAIILDFAWRGAF